MEDKNNHPEGCKCGECSNKGHAMGYGWHGKCHTFLIIRAIVAIILAIVIFWGGFMLGELHTINWFGFHGYRYGQVNSWGGTNLMM